MASRTGTGRTWIKEAVNPGKKGALHSALAVPQGETIPLKRVQAAAQSTNPTLRREAQFALNVRNLGRGKRG